jgi:hypothetical protein
MAGRLKPAPLSNNQPINNYEPNKNLFSNPSIGQAWRLGGRPRNRSFCICTTQVLCGNAAKAAADEHVRNVADKEFQRKLKIAAAGVTRVNVAVAQQSIW